MDRGKRFAKVPVDLVFPVAPQQYAASLAKDLVERPEQHYGGWSGPVEVINDNEQRNAPAELAKGNRRQLDEGTDIRGRRLVGLLGGETRQRLPGGSFELVRGMEFEQVTNGRNHLLEGDERPAFGREHVAGPAEHGPAELPGPHGDLAAKAGLPDARLTSHEDCATRAGVLGFSASVQDLRDFPFAPDEPTSGAAMSHAGSI